MLAGAYFSKPDWHSEYYWWPNFPTPDRNVNYDPAVYPEFASLRIARRTARG